MHLDLIPRQRDFPASMWVPFQARRLARPRLLWIDLDWLAAHARPGEDAAADPPRLRDWITGTCAYAVPQEHDAAEAFEAQEKTFFADRYGGMGVGPHAGSGRCGTHGQLQVKGIGVTPLVGVERDIQHSHGSVTVEEAIRELVYARLAGAELPYGAIPIVAIIATGTQTQSGEEKALIVRPNFFRTSALERAPYHRPLREQRFAHLEDVTRVRDAIRLLDADEEQRRRCGIAVRSLAHFIERVVHQLAFCQANRLYFGACTTSNLTINGEQLDYGSARSVRNWGRAVDTFPAFGRDDLHVFGGACEALSFYFGKYASGAAFAALDEPVRGLMERSYRRRLDQAFLALFGLERDACDPAAAEAICSVLRDYFARQQKPEVTLRTMADPASTPWFGDGLAAPAFDAATASADHAVAAAVERALQSACGDDPVRLQTCLAQARRTLRGRPLLEREALQASIHDWLRSAPADAAGYAAELARFVFRTVARSRRTFPGVPGRHWVHGYAGADGSEAVFCMVQGARKVMLLRGTARHGHDAIFGVPLPPAAVQAMPCVGEGYLEAPVPESYAGEAITIDVAGQRLGVPQMDVLF
ncbi:hypothetical protein [Xanthomonas sp. 1678]|uniref:hypothetical protein n=1 Tax=Xanthomonas sp. 1678 TaxID=3158788 RepID=UPI0028570EB2|nr:hypothetical protein [Xanthomonas translucens]